MIFDKFFTPKHKHKDPEKRLTAVQQVLQVDSKNLPWLHELAFNEQEISVRLAALSKLNELPLWLKAYEEARDPQLKLAAKNQVIESLEDVEMVSEVMFRDILLQQKYKEITQVMCQSSCRLLQDTQLLLDCTFMFGNESDIFRFFRERATSEQKLQIIDRFKNNEKAVKRLKRYDCESIVDEKLQQLLDEFQKLNELPKQIIQKAKLINAKLNALIDHADFSSIENKKCTLIADFEEIKEQFVYLSEQDASELSQKYLSLKARLDKKLSELRPGHERQLQITEYEIQQQKLIDQISSIDEQVALLSDRQVGQSIDTEKELLGNALDDAEATHQTLQQKLVDLSTEYLLQTHKQLAQQITSIKKQLDDAENTIEKNIFLNCITQELKDTNLEISQDQIPELKALLANADIRAGNLDDYSNAVLIEFRAARQQIQQIIDNQERQYQQLVRRCFGKLKVVDSLILQGKYNAALATFKVVNELFDIIAIPPKNLIKKYEGVKLEIQNLKDWQSYIAAPKKPKLLADAKSLIDDNALTVSARAAKIKQLRNEWSSLGRLESDEDSQLNQQFDDALERAFAPCRKYFEEKDRERADNANKIQVILDDIQSLASIENASEVQQKYVKLAQKFHQIKTVDHKLRRDFQKKFKILSEPLQVRIDELYRGRARQKQKLIDLVAKLLQEENAADATQQAKELQKNWKKIGFSGKQSDAQLWKSFREINDQIFDRESAERKHAEELSGQKFTQIMEKQKAIIQASEKSGSMGDIKQQIENLNSLRMELDGLTPSQKRKIEATIVDNEKRLSDQLFEKSNSEQRAKLNQIFIELEQWSNTSEQEKYPLINHLLLQSLPDNALFTGLDRQQLLQAILVLVDGGHSFKIDKSVQMQIMAAKLEGKEKISPKLALKHWIHRGPLGDEDKQQLATVKSTLEKNADILL